jgi:hypothetical protein
MKQILVSGIQAQNPSLILLQSRGYELGVSPAEEGSKELGFWFAQKDELEFRADDPLSLLGLVTLWESRGTTKMLPEEDRLDPYMDFGGDYF